MEIRRENESSLACYCGCSLNNSFACQRCALRPENSHLCVGTVTTIGWFGRYINSNLTLICAGSSKLYIAV